jgi:hypothetical protein
MYYKDERRYLFGCAGKVQHKTQISAEFALTHDRISDSNSEIYKCQFCGFLHIGTLWEDKHKIKIKVEKSKFQTKRQRKERIFNKKKIRRKGQ